jgi:hemerythrin-like metal-binding protein
MGSLKWNKTYSVSVKVMDDHHRELFKMIDEYYDAIKQKKSNEALLELLRKVKKYTQYHFNAEEQILRNHGYPRLNQQEKEHKAFTDKISEFEEALGAGQFIVSVSVTNVLRDWLENHINKIDKKYSEFLNERGIS